MRNSAAATASRASPSGPGWRYLIIQPSDDDHYVLVDLEFPTRDEAERLLATMHRVWSSGAAAPALAGSPQTRILDVREAESL